MRFFIDFVGFFLMVSLCNAAIVQRRTYRNTEEILVPVAIIQDGEEIKEPADLKENILEPQVQNLEPALILGDVAAAVAEEQKLEAVEAAVQAERRIDEAIVEEEIKEAIQEEQKQEIIHASEDGNNFVEVPQIVEVIQSENSEAFKEPAKEVDQTEKASDYKSVVAGTQTSNHVVLIEDTDNVSANNAVQQPEDNQRQATQATPTQSTTQQNFVQQLIQTIPLGQFFNPQGGAAPVTLPTLPPFAPFNAVYQGLQQFSSNIGNLNPFAGLGGQQQDPATDGVTTARPPGPIQQLVSNFFPQPSQPGPLQSFINLFQGNNAATTSPQLEPVKKQEVVTLAPEPSVVAAEITNNTAEQASNALRDSAETSDSFEESVQPNEVIVVNDDTSETENNENNQVQEVANI